MPLNANAPAAMPASVLSVPPKSVAVLPIVLTERSDAAKLRSNLLVSSSKNTFIFLAIIVFPLHC